MFGSFGLSKFERGILEHVKRAGCHINYVFDNESNDPPFGYSVGSTQTLSQPEVIVMGMNGELTGQIINDVLDRCRQGLQLTEGVVISGALDGFDLVVRTVAPENIIEEYFNSAIWYSKRNSWEKLNRAVQLVWPSPSTGLFPWQPGCEPEIRSRQPALFEASVQ